MKSTPILFSGPMVNAILNGTKTETRRVMKPQPDEDGLAYDLIDKAWVDTSGKQYKCPYGTKGDELWVKETWMPETEQGIPTGGIIYRATNNPIPDGDRPLKWHPSIFMSRKYSRLTLTIKDIQAERLQDISVDSMYGEGLSRRGAHLNELCDLRSQWCALWNSLNAERGHGWDTNPMVWVVKFEVKK